MKIYADSLRRGDVVTGKWSHHTIDFVDPYRVRLAGCEGEHPHVYAQTPDGTELFFGCGEEIEILDRE